jgi:hypothetical protein
MRAGIVVNVTPADRRCLEAIVADRSAPQKHVWRANIILATADGCGTAEIMRRSGKSKPVVWRWQERFMAEGVARLTRDKTRKPGKDSSQTCATTNPPSNIQRTVILSIIKQLPHRLSQTRRNARGRIRSQPSGPLLKAVLVNWWRREGDRSSGALDAQDGDAQTGLEFRGLGEAIPAQYVDRRGCRAEQRARGGSDPGFSAQFYCISEGSLTVFGT